MGVYSLQGSVVNVPMILVSLEILFFFIPCTVNKSHPVGVGWVLTIHKMLYNTVLTNLRHTVLDNHNHGMLRHKSEEKLVIQLSECGRSKCFSLSIIVFKMTE